MEGKDTSTAVLVVNRALKAHIELKLTGLRANLFLNTEADRVYL